MFQTLDTTMTHQEWNDSPLRFRVARDSRHEQMPPTTRCGLGQKMQRGTRAKITPVLRGAKPKVFGARLGQEQGQRMGKAPHCCGASQPKPDVGGTSDGFFRPAIGGNAGTTC
jgi:hypothetical protein